MIDEQFDAIIIGGGACGLMCAVQAGYRGLKTLILECNKLPGAKILISGGGRCNYTNLYTEAQNFVSANPHFSKSALSQFTVQDTISFFETYGISGAEKTLGQLFPTTNKAKDIVKVFTDLCAELDQQIRCNCLVKDVLKKENAFEVFYEINGEQKSITAKNIVIASGGLPVYKLGASDFGMKLARKFGLNVIETAPALVPLAITGKDQEWFAKLSGNTVFCQISNSKITFEENLLFTHWGLSGPSVLQISTYWKPGEVINIDLLPNKSITDIITKQKTLNGKQTLNNLLSDYFTKKLTEAMDIYLPIGKNLASLTKEEIETIHKKIHSFSVKPAGDKGYDKAEVMRGGVDTAELSSKTLEAKKQPGLFFGGECVDVTGWLGGYNFQWAWASGYVIAQNLR